MTQTINDDRVIELCLIGNEKAWSLFVERFATLIRWAIKDKISKTRLIVGANDIDDILQQVFADIWRKNRLRSLKKLSSIKAWLVIVAQNATIDFVRKDQRFRSASDILENESGCTAVDPRTETDSSDLRKVVNELISDLPIKERRIMTLELLYDLKHREIASIMNIPVNTTSTIISRIKQNIRNRLSERGYDV